MGPRGTRGLVTNGACDPQGFSPALASAVDLLWDLLHASSIVLCTGVLLWSAEGRSKDLWSGPFRDPRRELAR